MSEGSYDLTVKVQAQPREGSMASANRDRTSGASARVTLAKAFTIKPPTLELPEYRPHFLTAGESATVKGAYFGDGDNLLKVELEDLQGVAKRCKIIRSSMASITFELPAGIPGMCHLRISNSVGSAMLSTWGTFATPPENPPHKLGESWGGSETKDNAAAVVFRNKMWIFFPEDDGEDNEIQYKTWDGAKFAGDYNIKTATGSIQKSYAQPTPVVVKDTLYLFYTGLSGYLDYVIYYPTVADSSKRWQGYYTVPNSKLGDTTGRYAAVYNSVANRVEVYWTPDYTNAYVKYLDLGTGAWGGNQAITLPRTKPSIASYLTAVFNPLGTNDYVTYLSWDDGYAGFVGEIKDGTVLRYSDLWYWQPKNTKRGPSLADLGEDYLAVIYNHWDTYSSYQKYNKNTHSVVGVGQQYETKVPFTSEEGTSWAPNGVVFSTKVSDSTSPTGYRMDSTFYVLVGSNPKRDDTNWQLVETEYLGYWMPTNAGTVLDFASNNNAISNSFALWPVVGLIDMPPFVLNGNALCTDAAACSLNSTEISFEYASESGLSGEYSAGPYYETGKKSHVTADISAGYAGGFENSTAFSFTQTGGIENNLEGRIAAYFLAPKFKVYTLEWYDLNGTATGIYEQSVQVIGATIRKESFEPEAGPLIAGGSLTLPYLNPEVFPVHAFETDSERLASYSLVDPSTNGTSAAEGLLNTANVALGSPAGFSWAIDESHTVDNGCYVEMKIGVELGKRIGGFGIEGSFELHVTTSTQKSVEAKTQMFCPEPAAGVKPYIFQYYVEGFWLKPSSSGYWVPENRKGLGDAPWFITYRVGDYWWDE
jgi:hypothetical protein